MNRLPMQMHSLRRLEALEVLVLASNKLVAVHPSLWTLGRLVHLDLGHNNLAHLPPDIGALTRLTVRLLLRHAQRSAAQLTSAADSLSLQTVVCSRHVTTGAAPSLC
jgi:Leucine-rich repeat (LRR) protein